VILDVKEMFVPVLIIFIVIYLVFLSIRLRNQIKERNELLSELEDA